MHRPTCLAASTLSLWVLRGRRGTWAPCIYKVLSDLELLPGVIPLFREYGRGSLRPLNHFLLAQLPLLCVEYFNCWFEENTGKHL